MVLSANPSLAARSVAELVGLARERPKSINFGSGGAGSTSHVAAELLKALAKIDLVHVPYRGAAPSLAATIAGEVQLYFGSLPVTLPHGRSGKLRLLGVTTGQRTRAAAELPTLHESGVAGYEFATWYGLVAPAKTPRAIRTLLHSEIANALAKNSVQTRLLADGAEPVGSDPDAFQAFLGSEIDRWRVVLRNSGISPE
jgi:tripartite-type tricarboxylate transporter receptor subunit TctC